MSDQQRDLRKMLTAEEVIVLFMRERGCTREEAEELFERFKVDHPGIEMGEC